MADCCMCGLSVVTTNFVKVPSRTFAWKETGRYVGLCDGCLKACVSTDNSGSPALRGTCAICGIGNLQLYPVKYIIPSMEGREKSSVFVCSKCLKASRYTATEPYE